MKPVLAPAEAARDLEQGRDFYDRQQTGIGETFVRSLLSDIRRLEHLHEIHPVHFGLFRMLAERFPFGIYYEFTETAVDVYAVLDLRRDPLWIRSELDRR